MGYPFFVYFLCYNFMKLFILLIIGFYISLVACNSPIKHQFIGEAQGTYYSIIYYDLQDRDLQADIDGLLTSFDLSASNYQYNSIISKVNRGEDVVLDDIFLGNYNLALRISEETNGDFDITVRPLVQAWGFGSIDAQDMDSSVVDSILQFVGYRKLKLINGKIHKEDNRINLDFDAIAQGYAVDQVCNFLISKGIESYLVDIGGEIYASTYKNKNELWSVGIEQPRDSASYGENLSAILNLSAKGMATSGNYRKFYIKNGVKYAHTISPHTGFPIASRLLSATVIANTTAEADAYATSFMVMGVEKSKNFLKNHQQIDAFLIFSDQKGEFDTYFTIGIDSLLKK